MKEVWEVDNDLFEPGLVMHTVNWPLPSDEYAGSFMYHMNPNQIHLGLVIGLNYKNPHINLYEEFQRLKTHPDIRKYLEGGECVEYGARTLNEGGYHAIPNLTFPGGMIAGCSAGFLNVAQIKGSHTAMKTGMLAAETVANAIIKDEDVSGKNLTDYETKVDNSWVVQSLKESRNFQGGFKKGLWFGLAHGFVTNITKGKEPWTFKFT